MYGDTGEKPPSRGPINDDLALGMEYNVMTKYKSTVGSKEAATYQFLARHPLGVNVTTLMTQILSATAMTLTAPVQTQGGGPSGGGPPRGGLPGGGLPGGGPNPGGQANPPMPVAPVNGLRGNPPTMFDGLREKTTTFLHEFNIYCMLNAQNKLFSVPANCIIMALSYMRGPRVDNWA